MKTTPRTRAFILAVFDLADTLGLEPSELGSAAASIFVTVAASEGVDPIQLLQKVEQAKGGQ